MGVSPTEAVVSNGDDLITRLKMADSERERSVITNDLLREFHRGFALERLRELLESPEGPLRKSGVWIAAELGRRAAPLVEAVAPLLKDEMAYVRFFAIDSLLTTATEAHVNQVADIVGLLEDKEQSVRLKATDFFVRASDALLRAVSPGIVDQAGEAKEEVARLWVWLADGGDVPKQVLHSGMQSQFGRVRKLSAALAIRAKALQGELLALAEGSADADLRELARLTRRSSG
jgi:hypothetical protein